MKTKSENYWKKLADAGYRYGVEIVVAIPFSNGGLQPGMLGFKGKNYETAKEIWDSLERPA